jgi:hypothetical protein
VAILSKYTDLITLAPPWNNLESWWVIGALLFLSAIEFFADKIPAVNHVNDIIQTFVRPAAGAILFASSAHILTNIHPVLAMVMGILVAGTVHAVKSLAVRPAVTATTAGTGNVPVSIAEDITSTVLSIIAIILPVLIAVLLVMLGALFVWFIWRRINRERQSDRYPQVR